MARRLELKVLAHHGVKRDAESGMKGTGAGSNGATLHALSPQPKPASEKSSRR
jgi:hypothetical protein